MKVRIVRPPSYYGETISMSASYEDLLVKYVSEYKEVVEIARNANGKVLVFVSSIKIGQKITDLLNENCQERSQLAGFLSAENKEDEGKPIVDCLLNNQSFKTKVLVTTSVNDVGTNICDEEVRTIIIRAYEVEEMLQMLGRIRVSPDKGYQDITLYLWDVTINDLNKRVKSIRSKLEKIEEFERSGFNATEFFLKNLDEDKENMKFLYVSGDFKCCKFSKLCIYRIRELFSYYSNLLNSKKKDDSAFLKSHLNALGKDGEYSLQNFASVEIAQQKKETILKELDELASEILNVELSLEEMADLFLAKAKLLIRRIKNKYVRSNVNLAVDRFNEISQLENFGYKITRAKKRHVKYVLNKEEKDGK